MTSAQSHAATKAGFVAIIGAPNAGKSTLLNTLMGYKLAIVSPKAQTTRFAIRGILTHGHTQFIFVDTPGLHAPKRLLDEAMVAAATTTWHDADTVLYVLDATKGFTDFDLNTLSMIKTSNKPCFLALNKIDMVKDKSKLLPLMEKATELDMFTEVFAISALKNKGLDEFLDELAKPLPESPFLYDEETVTDQPARLLASETTREKAFLFLQDELPYGLTVDTTAVEDKDDGSQIVHQVIIIKREAHKPIVIGKGGSMLKRIGEAARKDLSKQFGHKIHLKLTVKVKPDWDKSKSVLQSLGLLNN